MQHGHGLFDTAARPVLPGLPPALPLRWVLLLAALTGGAGSAAAGTLETVRERGFLRCGVVEASPGFSSVNDAGERAGIDIDHCKAVAAAIFGALKIEYVPVTPSTAFTLLQSGGIDVFPDGATWTFSRDVSLGLDYAGVYLYAGQGFVVRRDSGIRKVADLDGATICIAQGTTLEQNLADYFDDKGLAYRALTFADIDMGLQAYRADRCDAFTNEATSTAGRIAGWSDRAEHLILDELISKEPFGPMVRQDDPRWRDIVLWTFNAQIAAEEFGISQANVAEVRESTTNAEVRRLLGVSGDFGARLGLSNDWAFDVIRLVGSYADQWERHFTPLGLSRGLNATWQDGGLLSALPFR